jgi:hypothetical protein
MMARSIVQVSRPDLNVRRTFPDQTRAFPGAAVLEMRQRFSSLPRSSHAAPSDESREVEIRDLVVYEQAVASGRSRDEVAS